MILVHERQKGNPLLQSIKNVKWAFNAEIIPDYVMNSSTCALFVTVKYHFKHPKHVAKKIGDVGLLYKLRVLLVYVDNENDLKSLHELNKIAFTHNYTLILAWSNFECARYLECYFHFDGKSTASIQQKSETEFLPKMTQVLTNVKSINKTDVATLMDVFGSLQSVCTADEQQLVLCPGLGEKKVKRLYQALHEPFNTPSSSSVSSSSSSSSSAQSNKEKSAKKTKTASVSTNNKDTGKFGKDASPSDTGTGTSGSKINRPHTAAIKAETDAATVLQQQLLWQKSSCSSSSNDNNGSDSSSSRANEIVIIDDDD